MWWFGNRWELLIISLLAWLLLPDDKLLNCVRHLTGFCHLFLLVEDLLMKKLAQLNPDTSPKNTSRSQGLDPTSEVSM